MGDIRFLELILILAIALVVFGPSRLPDMGRSLGRALREFRNAVRGEGHGGVGSPENAGAPRSGSDPDTHR